MDILSFLSNPTTDVYHSLPWLTYDYETTNLNKGDSALPENDIVLTSFIRDEGEVKSVWGGELSFPSHVIDEMEGDVILVGHNIKFDLKWAARAGLDVSKVMVFDTMIAEKVLLGNNPKNLRLSLDAVAKRRGMQSKEPFIDLSIKGGVCPSSLPESLLQRRCEYDVLTTRAVARQQLQELEHCGKLAVFLTRCLLTPVLADIEANGLFLDKERVGEEYERAKAAYADILVQLSSIRDINWNSSQQKAEALYDVYKFKELTKWKKPIRTPKGGRKADIDTVKALVARTKIQKRVQSLLVEQSKLNAELTKSLTKLKACCDADDILYAQFNQTVTKTDRLSSNGTQYKMQLQNIARIFKRLFTARHKHWLYCECDGSGLEFRTAVDMGDDEQGKADLDNPCFDPHTHSAQIILGKEDITKEERTDAKPHTFKPLYGGSSGTDAEKVYYESFKERYKGIAGLQQGWLDEALKHKSVVLPWGMEFFFPYTKLTRSGYQEFSTQICNYPVQSFATADIIPIALVKMWHVMKQREMNAFIVNTVHDSVEVEAPPEEREELNEIMIEAFTTHVYHYLQEVYNYTFTTTLGVGITWGTHWGEGEEMNIDVPNEGVIT